MYDTLIYQTAGGICTITLNRPEMYNAINDQLSYDLQQAFAQAAGDESVRVVVLTGAGKGFCSGQDLKSISPDALSNLADTVRKRYNPLILGMRNMPKPIVCRLNGVAAGAGCSLALACDLIIAAEEAILTELFVGIGLVLDSGSSFFLPRLTGYAKAFELATMGTRISAPEALSLGLINRVVPAGHLDEMTAQVAAYYASGPTVAVGLIKKMLNQSHHSTLEQMLEYEAQYQAVAGKTQDVQEGIAAFLEKRKANFAGK